MFNSKWALFSLVAICLAGGVYFFKYSDSTHQQPGLHNAAVISHKPNSAFETVVQLKSYEDDWCVSSEPSVDSETSAKTVYQEWAVSRNYAVEGRKDQIARYQQYDEVVLKSLGDQGDLIALSALVNSPRFSDQVKEWAARTAAVYGGTGDAMAHFSITNKGASTSLMRQGKAKEAKKAFLESVAWDEFSALRGDISLIENIAFTLSFDEMQSLEITEQDQAWVSARAKEIYNDLSQERSRRGLGGFDNSVPRAIVIDHAKFAAFAIEYYEVENQWFSKYFPPLKCLEENVGLLAK